MGNTGIRAFKRHTRKFLYNIATRALKNLDVVSMEREIEEMGDIYDRCKDITTSSKTRIYSLYKAVEYIVKSGIRGDFVECGVYRGGSCMIMALTLIKMKETDRKIYMYDTYRGMPEPTSEDVFASTGEKARDIFKSKRRGVYSDWCYSGLAEVKDNMFSTGYPGENMVFVEGRVQDTIPGTMTDRIALLSLDTDWYQSTLHELNHLFPVLEKGGVLQIDDYGTWKGQKKAVDEYIEKNNIPLLLQRIDQAGRICVKI